MNPVGTRLLSDFNFINSTEKTFNEFARMRLNSEKKFSSGGFRNIGGTREEHRIYKEYKYIIKAYNKILNRSSSDISATFKKIEKTKGDFSKFDKKYKDYINLYYKKCKQAIKSFHKSKYNLAENGPIALYVNLYDTITSSKMTAIYKKAYSEVESFAKNNSEPTMTAGIITINYSLMNVILAHMGLFIIRGIFDVDFEEEQIFAPDKSSFLESRIYLISSNYKTFIKRTFQLAHDLVALMNSIKNPSDVYNLIKQEKEARNQLAKGNESVQNEYDVLICKDEKCRSTESIMIIAGILMGIIAIFTLMRMSMYWIGKIKFDIIERIILENEVLTVNIELLRRKADKALERGDKKEYERLKKIAVKQEKWSMFFNKLVEDMTRNDSIAEDEADDEFENEEKTIDDEWGEYDDNQEEPDIIL